MKTVLVIGNGFDLNLHRHTSYQDFWNSEFCPKDYPAPLVAHLNSKWNESSEAVKWYDLENELLQYVRTIHGQRFEFRSYDIVTPEEQNVLKRHEYLDRKNINELYVPQPGRRNDIDVIRNLKEKGLIKIDSRGYIIFHRGDYDEFQLNAIERDKKALSLIKEGLCAYLSELKDTAEMESSVALATLCAISNLVDAGEDVSVYTFNYTSLPYDYEDRLNPQYIHGSCGTGNVIIGTKDSNELGRDYDFMQKSFDPNFKTPPVVFDLLRAEEIIFFGHSLGMNDSQYLQPFFKQQTNILNPARKNITIFTKDDKSVLEIKRALQDMTEFNFSLLNSLNSIEFIKTDGITKNWKGFSGFLGRFIKDEALIKILLRGLKDDNPRTS